MARRGGSETHRLILEFLIKGQAEKRLSAITRHLRSTNKDAQALLKTLNKLNSTPGTARGMGVGNTAAVTRETRAIREAVKLQQDRVRLEREQARLSQTRARATGAQRAAETADLRYLRERVRLEREAARVGRRTSSGRRRAYGDYDNVDRFNRAVRTGRNSTYVAQRTYDMVKGGFVDPALELKRAQTRFQLLNYPQADQAKGLKAVDQITSQLKGVRKVDVTELLTNLTGTMGSVNEAVELLPQAAKFVAATEALNGDKVGREQSIKAFTDAAKAVELMGKDVDTKTAKQFLNLIAQSNLATGGEINPAEFRNFIKQGQLVGMQMSPEGLMKFMPLIQQMGGKAAGTALTSLYSSVVGGQIPAHKLRYWEEMGLVDKSKVEYGKQGQIKRFLPGAIPIAEGMGKDPFQFTDKLMAAFDKKGIDTTNVESVAKQLEVMFGNRTAKREVAQMMLMRRQLDKETQNYLRMPDIESTYSQMFEKGNVLGKFLSGQADIWNTRATAGGPAAELSGSISEKLGEYIKSLQASSAENPMMSAAMISILSLGRASAEAADGVGIFNGMLRGGGGGGIGVTDAAVGGAAAVSKLGKPALGLGAALATNPYTWLVGAVLGGGYLLNRKANEYKQLDDQLRKGSLKNASAFNAGEAEAAAAGRPYTQKDYAFKASMALADIDREKSVFASARGGIGEFMMNFLNIPRGAPLLPQFTQGYLGMQPITYPLRFTGLLPDYHPFYGADDASKAALIRQRAPILGQNTGVMAEFLQQIRSRTDVSQEGKGYIENLVKQAFPQKYAEATTQATSAILGLVDPTQKTAQAFGQCVDPAIKLAPGLRDSATAAQSFASRVNSLEIKAPTYTFTVGNDGKINVVNDSNPKPPPAKGSAIGSVIKSSGIVHLHKGNVVFPASLSRRSPGDWLQDAYTIRKALDADKRRNPLQAIAARSARSSAQSSFFMPSAPSPASYALSALSQKKNSPALALTAAKDSMYVNSEATVGRSARGSAAAAFSFSGPLIGSLQINIPPGSEAARDPRSLARLVRSEVEQVLDENLPRIARYTTGVIDVRDAKDDERS